MKRQQLHTIQSFLNRVFSIDKKSDLASKLFDVLTDSKWAFCLQKSNTERNSRKINTSIRHTLVSDTRNMNFFFLKHIKIYVMIIMWLWVGFSFFLCLHFFVLMYRYIVLLENEFKKQDYFLLQVTPPEAFSEIQIFRSSQTFKL